MNTFFPLAVALSLFSCSNFSSDNDTNSKAKYVFGKPIWNCSGQACEIILEVKNPPLLVQDIYFDFSIILENEDTLFETVKLIFQKEPSKELRYKTTISSPIKEVLVTSREI